VITSIENINDINVHLDSHTSCLEKLYENYMKLFTCLQFTVDLSG